MGLLRNRISRRVIVDDRPVETNEISTAANLINAAGRDPQRFDLIVNDGRGGSQLIPSNQRINLSEGQRFETSMRCIGG